MAAATAAAAGAAAHVVSNPNPKPGGNRLRSPGKAVALADITNTGRPNPGGSINAVVDVLKENTKLRHLLAEKTKVIEASKVDVQKLCFALQAVNQKNQHLAQANSQMLKELNEGKDRLKLLQHELACKTTVLKVKASELEEMKAIRSKLAPSAVHQKATSSNLQQLVETHCVVPSYTGRQEPLQDKTNKRRMNRRKSESSEVMKDINTVQNSCNPHLQSNGSLLNDDPRKTLRRRSARLNPGSCEVTEVSCDILDHDTVVPSVSSLSAPKQSEPSTGNDMGKSLQNELPYDETVHEVEGPELKEIQETGSRVTGVQAHQIDDMATDTNPNHLAVTQSLQLFSTEHPELPQDRGDKRKSTRKGANKRTLESCEGRKASNIEEDINAKCHSKSDKALHLEERRKLSRRKSSRLDPGSCEVTKDIIEIVQEDTSVPLVPSSSNAVSEHTKNDIQNGCSSLTKPSEEQVTGGRSSFGRPSRRASVKIVSYKEIPLNVKMRRP